MNDADFLKTFNQLYADYRERFIRFAYSYTKDKAVSEDITAESFMSFWENRKTIPNDENLPAYILTIVKNRCLNYLRHQKIEETVAENIKNTREWALQMRISTLEACEPKELFSAEVHEIIRKTLADMPEKTRQIFIMSRYKNKTYLEIAQDTGLTVKGVEYHISMAIKRLKNNLKDYIHIFILFF